MPGGKGKIRPEDGTEGFQKHPENINRNGRPISIRNQIREMLQADGSLTIPKRNVISINEDGSIDVLMPKKDAIAMRLMQWALSNKGTDALKAIQMIIEHLEGRPHQSATVDINQPVQQYELTDDQFEKIMKELKPNE
jgi:flagellar basal body rod protein FlgF